MRSILLTQGYKVLVDDEDYEELSKYQWTYDSSTGYAKRRDGAETIRMHRYILNAPRHLETDHKDGNGLNNSRSNLRLCTHTQNAMNRISRPGSSSIYKGVGWDKTRNKWVCRIVVEQYTYNLGRYESEIQAAVFYDIAAVHFFGEFARLNFPEYKGTYEAYWEAKE